MPARIPSAGELDQRVQLQRRDDTQVRDELGTLPEVWITVATLWAKVEPLRGREYFAAGQMQAATDVRVTIRFRADVRADWRVVHRSRPMGIASVIDIEARREFLELMCVEGVRDGR
ncbi:MAG: phage head closure protein [Burkholderiaceae bacterium]|nr:phage head closure protein [Burkholderiaceae bacterium]